MPYFDYRNVALEAKIPDDKVKELERIVRSEFPNDEMMFELHMLRVCMAIRDKALTIEQALEPDRPARLAERNA
jgi:hypothetical protein